MCSRSNILLVFVINVIFMQCEGRKTFNAIKKLVQEKRLSIEREFLDTAQNRLNISEHTIVQPLDHFDAQVPGTFKQRYWVNEEFWDPENGPIIVYIGGEGDLSDYRVLSGTHVDYAKKLKALVIAIEHRFYGESLNDNGLELDNMQHLSSQQALADLANFHVHATSRYSLTTKNRWISFGGSYAGMLSSWFRIKYPHLVFASISESSPVHAKVNMEEYNEVIASSLSNPRVNGSSECLGNVRAAFATIDQMISTQKFKSLQEDFAVCNPIGLEWDYKIFVENIADIFMATIQYNGEVPGMDISGLCKYMNDPSYAPYENLIRLNKMFLKMNNQSCQEMSFIAEVKDLMNTTVIRGGDYVWYRQWVYQTCTEVAYFFTCYKNTSCPFSHYMALDISFTQCQLLFPNIEANDVYRAVKFHNAYYGSDHPKGSRIIYINGDIDPWHKLSVLEDQSETELAIIIPGTAHCAFELSHPQYNPPELVEAKEKVLTIISKWLQEDREAAVELSVDS